MPDDSIMVLGRAVSLAVVHARARASGNHAYMALVAEVRRLRAVESAARDYADAWRVSFTLPMGEWTDAKLAEVDAAQRERMEALTALLAAAPETQRAAPVTPRAACMDCGLRYDDPG